MPRLFPLFAEVLLPPLVDGVADEPADHGLNRSCGGLTTKVHLACTGLPPVPRDDPETGPTHTRIAVASHAEPARPRTRRRRAGSGRLGNAAGRRRPGDRGVYSVPVVSAKISSAIW
jgi:hypothetical protein